MPGKRAFSLLETSAALMLVFAVIAIAVPIYRDAQSASAARACMANLKDIANAESRFAERTGHYTSSLADLVGNIGGLRKIPVCPLHANSSYTAKTSDSSMASVVIRCPNDAEHAAGLGAKSDYSVTLTLAGVKPDSR